MGITFAGMGLSLLVRVLLIPKRFGFSDTADALTAALTVVLLVDTIVREGAKFSLVPVFVTREKEMTRTEYQRFTNSLLILLISIGFGIFILVELFAPWIAAGLLQKSTVDVQKTTTLLRFCAPLLIFGCGSTVLGAFLNSQQRFKTVALRNALPAGTAAFIFLILWNTQCLENYVAMAYTGGFIAYFGWLCLGAYRTGHRYAFTGVSVDTLRSLKNTVALPTLGFGIRQIVNRLLVEVYLVSQLGSGAITLYKSAFQICSALQTLIGISIATTGLPDMAAVVARRRGDGDRTTTEHAAANNKVELGRTLNRNARMAIIIGFPVTLVLLIFHGKISWLLYGRGTINETSIELIGQLLFLAQHRNDILLSDTCAECWALRPKGIPRYFHKYGDDGDTQFSDSVRVNGNVVAAIRCVIRINHCASCCWKSDVSPPKNTGVLVLTFNLALSGGM